MTDHGHGHGHHRPLPGHLLPHLRPGLDLLDVGCGSGEITAELAALVAPGRVVGVDPQPAEPREGVELVVGDVQALGFADDTFDVAQAHQVLHHVADPVAALREMRRVCRPGGVVAARDMDFEAFSWFPTSDGLDEWLAGHVEDERSLGYHPDAGRRLRSWALQAGFADVTSTASVDCYASTDERAQLVRRWGHQAPGVFEKWAAADDGWFVVLHGELLARA